MSWSRRHLLAALALGGCGFAPVYGPDGAAARGQIALRTPQTVAGYHLLTQLEERLGAPNAARYVLEMDLTVTQSTSLVGADTRPHQITLTGLSRWTLREGDTVLATGTLRHITSYIASGTTVATEAAHDDALARLARGVADRVTPRIWAAL